MSIITTCTPDFYGEDFYQEDFDTEGGFPIRFKNYIFSLFTRYFIEHDTYKDGEDKGILERYMAVFGEELDEEVVNQLQCYLNIIDAQICDKKYLVHIADVLGNPPDIFMDTQIYRNLLTYVVANYKIKGTKAAYELFFSILGFGVTLTELPILSEVSNYDTGGIYDIGLSESIYDQTECEPCSEYDIDFYALDSQTPLNRDTIDKLRAVIYFNEPINAKLRKFTTQITIEDTLEVEIIDEAANTTLI